MVSMIFASILLGGIGIALRRQWRRAALVASIVILLINFYGILTWWSGLPIVAVAVWLAWNARPSHKFSKYANIVITFWFLCPSAVIGWQTGLRDWFFVRDSRPTANGNQPDIYFIVMDSYTSHELLLERFGYDNTPFLDSLTSLGFKVGDCQSSYSMTDYSLASTLNPEATNFPENNRLWEMIRNSQVREVLQERGYGTIGFETGFVWTELLNADIYYQPSILFSDLNIFEIYYLQNTPFDLIFDNSYDLDTRLSEIYRERTLTLLTHLPDAAEMDGPQFVFAHILQPHPPFVFDVDGNSANWHKYSLPGFNPATRSGYSPEGYAAGYVVEVQYIEKAILPPLEAILTYKPDSTIILTADHGPWFTETVEESLSTLCAVYGPNLSLEPEAAFEEIIK